MLKKYKDQNSLSFRIEESQRILTKFPDRIPIIIDCPKELDKILIKKKFLVPREISISYFLSIIRNKTKLESNRSVFIFCDNKLLSGTKIIGEVYDEYEKNAKENSDFLKGDKSLYMNLAFENTFG